MIASLLVLLALAAVAPVALLVLELLASLPRWRAAPPTQGPFAETVIVMPAHNEAAGIGDTLAQLKGELGNGVRLLVVADNCSDDTAAIARAAGVEVIERHDDTLCGKGFALDHGIRHLAAHPPAVVVIVDADCQVSPGTIQALAAAALETGRPIQAQYLLRPHADAGVSQAIAAFAFRLKNHCRPLGMQRLGLPCHLTGSGMAFPWDVLASSRLASSNIVEDMQLGIDLARIGKPALFLPEALVTSPFPRTDEARRIQQQRWEHGHLGLLRGEAVSLMRHGISTRQWRLAVFALDLMVPPLALMLGLLMAGIIVAGAMALLGLGTGPLLMLGLALLTASAGIVLCWHRFGREDMPPAALATVPRFAFNKLRLYVDYALGRRSTWVRTDRS